MLQFYIMVDIRKKRRKETINPNREEIHFDYTSQILAKTVIIVLIPNRVNNVKKFSNPLLSIRKSKERKFKPGLKISLNNKR